MLEDRRNGSEQGGKEERGEGTPGTRRGRRAYMLKRRTEEPEPLGREEDRARTC